MQDFLFFSMQYRDASSLFLTLKQKRQNKDLKDERRQVMPNAKQVGTGPTKAHGRKIP